MTTSTTIALKDLSEKKAAFEESLRALSGPPDPDTEKAVWDQAVTVDLPDPDADLFDPAALIQITRAQFDDLSGLVSDIQTSLAGWEREIDNNMILYARGTTQTRYMSWAKAHGLIMARDDMQRALEAHPSIAVVK